MKKYSVRIFTLLIILLPFQAMAIGTIGDVANNILGPTSIVTKMVDVACIVIGISFLLIAFSQFKIHRHSPKLIPLMTPIIVVILGVIALLIPYATTLTETGKAKLKSESVNLLPTPSLEAPKTNVPYPPGHHEGGSEENKQQGEAHKPPQNPPPKKPPRSPGHWSQDPRYNQ